MREIERQIVAAIIVSRDNKILSVKGNPSHQGVYSGYWLIPGGGIEEGETKEEAIIREIREETGIDISRFKLELIPYSHSGTSEKTLRTGERVLARMNFIQFIVVVDDADAKDIRVTLSREHSEYGWFSKGELPKLKLSPPSRELFKALGYIT